MDWLMHNPVADMYGPYFLIVYGSVIVVILATCRWWVRQSDPTRQLGPPDLPKDVDPYEVAYLRGGKNEVTRLAVFDLMQQGYLEIVDAKTLGIATQKRISQKEGHPDVGCLTPIGKVVCKWFSAPRLPGEVFQRSGLPDEVNLLCQDYEKRIVQQSFRRPDEVVRAAWQVGLAAAAIIAGLGAYKLAVALAKGKHNVGFLILIGIAGLVLTAIFCKPSGLSYRGRMYLKRLKETFAGLKTQAAPASAGPAPMLLLGVGIFGLTMLSRTSYADCYSMFSTGSGSSDYSGGCGGAGGGCGGGGGGGGGCGGGGGGGGCGGCGGGGGD